MKPDGAWLTLVRAHAASGRLPVDYRSLCRCEKHALQPLILFDEFGLVQLATSPFTQSQAEWRILKGSDTSIFMSIIKMHGNNIQDRQKGYPIGIDTRYRELAFSAVVSIFDDLDLLQ